MRLYVLKILFTLAAALMFGASFSAQAEECRGEDLILTLTPTPIQKPSSFRRFFDKERQPTTAADVILIGDSLLDNWPDKLLNDAFGQLKVINWAVGGDRIQNVLWQLEQTKLGNLTPKVLVIMVGVNNLLGDGSQSCAVAAGTAKLVDETRKKWPKSKILLVDMLPFGAGYVDKDRERISIHESIREYFKGNRDISFLNLDDLVTCGLRGKPLPARATCGPAASPCEYYQKDNTHLTPEGYKAISSPISDKVKMLIESGKS